MYGDKMSKFQTCLKCGILRKGQEAAFCLRCGMYLSEENLKAQAALPNQESQCKHVPTKPYRGIAQKVMNQLNGRRGYDNLWDDLGDELREEILEDIASIIEENIT
jgi:predicted amidophosphoribosyltransferase